MARFRPRLRRSNDRTSLNSATRRRNRFRRLFPRTLPFDGFRMSRAVGALLDLFRATPSPAYAGRNTSAMRRLSNLELLEDRRLLAVSYNWVSLNTAAPESGSGGTVPMLVLNGNIGGMSAHDINFSLSHISTTAADVVLLQSSLSIVADPSYSNTTINLVTGDVTPTTTALGANVGPIISITNDRIVELNESFTITANDSSGQLNGGPTTATHTIQDDDTATLSIQSVSYSEGDGTQPVDVELTINAVGTVGPAELGVMIGATVDDLGTGTATAAGTDYTFASQAVSFPAGSAHGATQSVLITIIDDGDVEPNETVDLGLSSAVGPVTLGAGGTVTILDNDTGVAIAADQTALTEGNSGTTAFTFTVSRTGDVSGTSSVDYNVTGTGGNPANAADFDGGVLPSGSVNFLAGETTKQITVLVVGDTTVEMDEEFTVTLSNPVGASIVSGQGTASSEITNDDSATVSVDSPSVMEGNSGTTTLTFTVSLSEAVDVDVDIDFATADDTASSASDYLSTSGTVTISAGSLSATIDVDVNGDTLVELNETFFVNLSSIQAQGRDVTFAAGGDQGTGTIVNDDSATISISNESISEGDVGTSPFNFTITLSNPVDFAVAMDVSRADGTATLADNDYGGTLTGVTFLSGVSGPFTVVAAHSVGDMKVEADEVFSVILSNLTAGGRNVTFAGGGSTETGTATILNDDTALVSISKVTDAAEPGTNGQFLVTLSQESDTDTTISYSVTGSATPGSDYTALSGTVTIPAGSTSAVIDVLVIDDVAVEGTESVIVTLDAVTAGHTGSISIDPANDTATVDILDDDLATLTVDDVSVNEGAGTATVKVTLNEAVAGGFTVVISTTDGTATVADNDYVAASQTLTFAGNAGEMQFFTITINNDSKVENDETINISMGPASNPQVDSSDTATVTIVNDDSATISISDVTQFEGSGGGSTSFIFTVTLSHAVQGDVLVNFNVADGLATAADDFSVMTIGPLNFGGADPGAGATDSIVVEVTADSKVEADENFFVHLTGFAMGSTANTAAISLPGSPATGVILNDDTATLTITDVTMAEGTGGGPTLFIFDVEVDNAVQGGFQVHFVVNDGTATEADDFDVATSSPLVFAGTAGETHQIVVEVDPDNIAEADETFEVLLNGITTLGLGVNPTNIILPAGPGVGTILNDDGPMIVIGDVTKLEGTGGVTQFIFHVELMATVQDADGFDVHFTVHDGTATAADDFTVITSSPLHFAASGGLTSPQVQQIIVEVTADSKVEADEAFTITLDSITGDDTGNVTHQVAPATGIILNDDFATVTIDDVSLSEGNSGTKNFDFTVTLSHDVQGGFDLGFLVNHVTTDAADWTQITVSPLSFAGTAGETHTIRVAVNGDTVVEPDEIFHVQLDSSVTNTATGINPTHIVPQAAPGVGTILNDDNIVVRVISQSVDESVGTVTVTIEHDPNSASAGGAFTVDVIADTSGGATAEANDFVASAAMLSFSGVPGDTQTYTFSIIDDNRVEDDETVTIALSGQSPPNFMLVNGTVTILNNDVIQVEFQSGMTMAVEGDNSPVSPDGLPMLVVTGEVEDPVTLNISAVGGAPNPASASDFNQPATVVIGAGSYNATPVSTGFTSVQDNLVEPDETVELTLTPADPTRAVIVDVDSDGFIRSTTEHIIKNDDSPNVDVAVNGQQSVTINEGDTVTLALTINNTAQAHSVLILWGDGQSTNISVLASAFSNSQATLSVTHQYLDDGPSPGNGTPQDTYNVQVLVQDTSGPVNVNTTPTVTVNNVPPTFTSIGVNPTSGNVGQQVTVVGNFMGQATFTDPGILDRFELFYDITQQFDAMGNRIDNFVSLGQVSGGVIPNFQITITIPTTEIRFRILDDDTGQSTVSLPISFGFPPPPPVNATAHLFYNNSGYDGNTPGASPLDALAIDPSKASLGIGQTATSANISGYTKGINGVIITGNFPNDGAGIDPTDFNILVGATNNINTWAAGPAPSISVTPNDPAFGGLDRVTLIWPDNSIVDTYVAIQLLANVDTGIASTQTFIYGSVAGDTGAALVAAPGFFGRDAFDLQNQATNLTPIAQFGTEPVTKGADVNKSRSVDAFDFHATASAGLNPAVLPVITPIFGGPAVAGVAAVPVDEALADEAEDVLPPLADSGSDDGLIDGRVGADEDDDRDLAFATFGSDNDSLFDSDAIGAIASGRLSLV